MKKPLLLFFVIIFLNACNVYKYSADFKHAKANNEIVLLYNEINSVEKTKALNVLISKYLDTAPNDEILTTLINQYIKYYLDAKGYKTIIIKQDYSTIEQTKKLTYELVFDKLLIREFKKSEYVSDQASGTSDKVKLKGIETTISADLYLLKNKIPIEGATKKIKALEREIESHSGEFKHTKNLKEHVLKENGSVKYLAEINDLGGGIFQNQCILVAEKIAEEINSSLVHIYIKEKRRSNKKLKK